MPYGIDGMRRRYASVRGPSHVDSLSHARRWVVVGFIVRYPTFVRPVLRMWTSFCLWHLSPKLLVTTAAPYGEGISRLDAKADHESLEILQTRIL